MKKILVSLLCVMMVFCMMPTFAFGNELESEVGAVASASTGEGIKYYDSLYDAVKNVTDGGTVTLLQDSDGVGIGTYKSASGEKIQAKNMIIDLNSHTYTIGGSAVGSPGYETQAFHFEWSGDADANYNVTIKNGTITSTADSGVYMLIQNYCNLTLENVTVDGSNVITPSSWSQTYVLSNNCGTVTLSGETNIIAKAGDVAFDVCRYNPYPKVNVIVNTTGTINGEIEVSHSSSSVIPDTNSSLTINSGLFKNFSIDNQDTAIPIKITGGTFSTDVKEYITSDVNEYKKVDETYIVSATSPANSSGYNAWTQGEDGIYTEIYVPVYVPTTPTTPTDNVTNSGTAGTDNATTSADLSGTTSTSDGTTTSTVDQDTADKIVDKAVENKSEEVVIDATANTSAAADSTIIAQVGIPTATLEAIAEQTDADVTVKTDVAEVKMDNATAGAVAEQAAGDTVQIIVEKVDETADKVEFELKIVCSQGNVIRDFNGGNVAVTVAVPKAMAGKDLVCVYIDDNGRMTKVKGQKNADGTYTFITGHFSTYALMTEDEADEAIAAQEEAIQNIKIVLRSKQVTMKNGKKAIKLTWTTDSDIALDGMEIFRSTKRYSGYGKTPFFTTEKDAYYNTAIKTGTRYYYRARGYVEVEGEKIYTDYSTKAWRLVR